MGFWDADKDTWYPCCRSTCSNPYPSLAVSALSLIGLIGYPITSPFALCFLIPVVLPLVPVSSIQTELASTLQSRSGVRQKGQGAGEAAKTEIFCFFLGWGRGKAKPKAAKAQRPSQRAPRACLSPSPQVHKWRCGGSQHVTWSTILQFLKLTCRGPSLSGRQDRAMARISKWKIRKLRVSVGLIREAEEENQEGQVEMNLRQ